MIQFTPGLILEALLLLLLMVTVGYCVVLNRRLTRLRDSQHELRTIVSDLSNATFAAENAIKGLRTTTDEAETRLADKLHRAHQVMQELSALERTDRKIVRSAATDRLQESRPAAAVSGGPRQAAMSSPPQAPEPQARDENATSSRDLWRVHAQSRLKRAS